MGLATATAGSSKIVYISFSMSRASSVLTGLLNPVAALAGLGALGGLGKLIMNSGLAAPLGLNSDLFCCGRGPGSGGGGYGPGSRGRGRRGGHHDDDGYGGLLLHPLLPRH